HRECPDDRRLGPAPLEYNGSAVANATRHHGEGGDGNKGRVAADTFGCCGDQIADHRGEDPHKEKGGRGGGAEALFASDSSDPCSPGLLRSAAAVAPSAPPFRTCSAGVTAWPLARSPLSTRAASHRRTRSLVARARA